MKTLERISYVVAPIVYNKEYDKLESFEQIIVGELSAKIIKEIAKTNSEIIQAVVDAILNGDL